MPSRRTSLTRLLHRKFSKSARPLAIALPLTLIAVLLASRGQAATMINAVDSAGNVGRYSSMVLDGSGNPVISYWDFTNGDLKLTHCNDTNCSGGNESLVTVDSPDFVGEYSSLALDNSGFPVVSYWDATNDDLKLAHCNDANCAGGNESLVAVDSVGEVGEYTSLVLDSSGFPVVSYWDATKGDLKLAHCNDVNCSGGDESLVAVDAAGVVGWYPSLVLDGSGNPVISYYDETNDDLKLAHCSDANCNGYSIVTVDSGGWYTSLVLDSSGFPVISYWDGSNRDLKLAHCTDANCNGHSIVTVDSGGDVGRFTSLALDSLGFPVVSYYDDTGLDLKLAHCSDPDCNAHSLVTVDSIGDVGREPSLVLDSFGFPVVSYYDLTNGDLKLAHCDDANCAGGDESLVTVDSSGDINLHTSLALDSSGFPVVSYYKGSNGDLNLAHCNDANCAGGDESLITVDSGGGAVVGWYSSLILDGSGFPVISYYDLTNKVLKLAHCTDANCNGHSIVTVDSSGDVGLHTSLVLDGSGFPVVSYYDGSNGDLKLAHCNDPNCAGGGESLLTVDSIGFVGAFTSLALDGSGFPVVSYYDGSNGDLKLAHCNDANCAGGNESIVAVDSDGIVGEFTSLVLDGSGFPVVSYRDITNGELKLAHCNDVNCAGGDESIVTVDPAEAVGVYTSLALDSSGSPLVSYFDLMNFDLKLAHCNDANCAGGDESIVALDTAGSIGWYPSLVLDGSGYPVVSYSDNTNGNLKLAHCNDSNCAGPLSEMDVQGNGVSIADGDTMPATTDHTDFGNAAVDGGTITRTFTILNTGDADLSLTDNPRIMIPGAQAAEFALTAVSMSPIAAGGQTTFQVTFDPRAVGLRQATISIGNNDADENPYSFSIQGTGISSIYLPIVQRD